MGKQPKLTEKQLEKLSNLLFQRFESEKRQKRYAQVKLILSVLGKGILLPMIFVAPGTARLAKDLFKDNSEWETWKQYNLTYLRQTIKRLKKQKMVEIADENGKQVVKLSQNGKHRILKYALDELEITKPSSWDAKWRLVIYDIPNRKRYLQTLVRETLKRLGFLQLQESVYLIPFPCFGEIEFLREYYGLGENIKILTVAKLEDDKVYRTYFGV